MGVGVVRAVGFFGGERERERRTREMSGG